MTPPKDLDGTNANWLNSTPQSGDLGNLGRINVDSDGVLRFSTQVFQEMENNFGTSLENGVFGLLEPAQMAPGAPFFTEAADFRVKHAELLDQMSQFTQELFKGMTALGFGAQTVAFTYRDADADSAAAVNAVNGAFSPTAGQATSADPPPPDSGSGADAGTGDLPTTVPPITWPTVSPADATPSSGQKRDRNETVDLGNGDSYTYALPDATTERQMDDVQHQQMDAQWVEDGDEDWNPDPYAGTITLAPGAPGEDPGTTTTGTTVVA